LPGIATTPFIFLTAAMDRNDMRRGMSSGADDYLTKPFAVAELLARVRAALRHNARTPEVQLVSFDGITADAHPNVLY